MARHSPGRGRRTATLLAVVLLIGLVVAAVWHWAMPSTPRGEHSYQGKSTSEWRELLLAPSVSSSWPPHNYPLLGNPDPAAIAILVDFLSDPEPSVRGGAIDCLAAVPNPPDRVVRLVLDRLKDPDRGVRTVAMFAAARIGQPAAAAIPHLRAALADTDEAISQSAASAYYELTGDPEPLMPILIRGLQRRDGREMGFAYSVARIGPRAVLAVDAIVDRLNDDSVPPRPEGPSGIPVGNGPNQSRDIIHRAMLEALAGIGPGAKSALPTVQKFLRAQNGFVRASACVAHWKITGEAGPALGVLVDQLNGEHDQSWSASALGSMGKAAEPAIPALRRALDHKDWTVRFRAAEALGKLGPKAREAVPRMIELAREDQSYFRKDIVAAIISLDAAAAADAGLTVDR